MSRPLVVTADDFGLTDGVNRAVLRAHRNGVVTSASLLAVGQAYDGAVRLARQAPDLAVGVHLAAVGEDPPLLPAAQVPTLVGRDGRFPLTYRSVLRRAAAGRLDPQDLRQEFRAQIRRVRGDGLAISHLDTHQHLHLWPAVATVVMDLAAEFGVAAVRRPTSRRLGPVGLGVAALSWRLARRLDAAGLQRTAGYAGLDEAGELDRHLPAVVATRGGRGSVELNAHPGEAGDPDLARFAWGYRWGQELAALTDPGLREDIRRAGFHLASWAELGRTMEGTR